MENTKNASKDLIQHSFNNETLELIKNTVAPKDLTPKEFDMFIYQAKRTGLDPLSRQIYCIKLKDKVSIQSTIDGFRLIAERTGLYAGQTPVMWCNSQGKWYDVWLEAIPPLAAKVGVIRKDFSEPLIAVARFDTYAQKLYDGKLKYNWAKMPDLMIGKCAEALALRKAFPQELSNIYSADEMANFEEQETKSETKPIDKGNPYERISVANDFETLKVIYDAFPELKENADFISALKNRKIELTELTVDNITDEVNTLQNTLGKDVPFLDMPEFKRLSNSDNVKELKTIYKAITSDELYKMTGDEFKSELKIHYNNLLSEYQEVKA